MQTSQISHIYKYIYISDYKQAISITNLKKHNIGAILHLGNVNKPQKILYKYDQNNIKHSFIKILDTYDADLTVCFDQAWDFINKCASNKTNVIVHCRHGISRSPAVVAYYLMRIMYNYMHKKNQSYPIFDEVMELIQISRPCINPNTNFLNQLKNYENKEIKIYQQTTK